MQLAKENSPTCCQTWLVEKFSTLQDEFYTKTFKLNVAAENVDQTSEYSEAQDNSDEESVQECNFVNENVLENDQNQKEAQIQEENVLENDQNQKEAQIQEENVPENDQNQKESQIQEENVPENEVQVESQQNILALEENVQEATTEITIPENVPEPEINNIPKSKEITLALYPKGPATVWELYTFIYAHFKSSEKIIDQAQYRIAILAGDGVKRNITEAQIKITDGRAEFWSQIVIRRDYLMNPANRLLVNDALTVQCEVYYPGSPTYSHLRCGDCLQTSSAIYEDKMVLNDLNSMLQNGKYSDVTFVVGSSKREFKLHRNILATRSAAFESLFSLDTKEKNKIEIKDVLEEVFELLVQYIYTGKIPPLDQYPKELFIASVKFKLDSLRRTCEEALCQGLTIENVTGVLILADTFDSGNVKQTCIEFISGHSAKVMITDGWSQLIDEKKIILFNELYQHLAEFRSN